MRPPSIWSYNLAANKLPVDKSNNKQVAALLCCRIIQTIYCLRRYDTAISVALLRNEHSFLSQRPSPDWHTNSLNACAGSIRLAELGKPCERDATAAVGAVAFALLYARSERNTLLLPSHLHEPVAWKKCAFFLLRRPPSTSVRLALSRARLVIQFGPAREQRPNLVLACRLCCPSRAPAHPLVSRCKRNGEKAQGRHDLEAQYQEGGAASERKGARELPPPPPKARANSAGTCRARPLAHLRAIIRSRAGGRPSRIRPALINCAPWRPRLCAPGRLAAVVRPRRCWMRRPSYSRTGLPSRVGRFAWAPLPTRLPGVGRAKWPFHKTLDDFMGRAEGRRRRLEITRT